MESLLLQKTPLEIRDYEVEFRYSGTNQKYVEMGALGLHQVALTLDKFWQ